MGRLQVATKCTATKEIICHRWFWIKSLVRAWLRGNVGTDNTTVSHDTHGPKGIFAILLQNELELEKKANEFGFSFLFPGL